MKLFIKTVLMILTVTTFKGIAQTYSENALTKNKLNVSYSTKSSKITKWKISMTNKSYTVILVFIFLLINGCGGSGGTKKVNCDAFQTQPEAQTYFESHNASNLDRDNDGIACENLPDNKINVGKTDLVYFNGAYILLGEICDERRCSAQTIKLEIITENIISLCLPEKMESSCVDQKIRHLSVRNDIGYTFLFENGLFQFGSDENGHVKIILDDRTYYGHGILFTDTSEYGIYNSSGVLVNGDGSYSLSSKAGQIVHWDRLNGISLSSN